MGILLPNLQTPRKLYIAILRLVAIKRIVWTHVYSLGSLDTLDKY